MAVRLCQALIAVALLAPFVAFQAMPASMPSLLGGRVLGIPATVLLVVAGYVCFVALICWFMRDGDSSGSTS